MKNLCLSIQPSAIHRFYEVLQNGFFVKCLTGISVQSLLCEQLGLNPRYVNERITTVFLDGSCVDNIERAVIKEGSILALSSAMPGLAGATMRRGSMYASLRSSITYNEKDNEYTDMNVVIKVKLFNLLIDELGLFFLQRGILVKADEMLHFLKKQAEGFWDGCSEIVLDGKAVGRGFLLADRQSIQSGFIYFNIIITEAEVPSPLFIRK